jgi:hypothetical protein
MSDYAFRERFFNNLLTRFNVSWMQVLIFSLPFLAIFLPSLFRSVKRSIVVATVLLCAICDIFFLSSATFPHQNVLLNMSIGPDTFYESWTGGIKHTYSAAFGKIMTFVKYFFSTSAMVVLALVVIKKINGRISFSFHPVWLFPAVIFMSYLIMLYSAVSFFDRYHLPLISLGMVLFSYIIKDISFDYRVFVFIILLFYYVAVAGTRDYIEMNRTRWKAVNYLRQTKNIPLHTINAGFEVNNWNEGNPGWWVNFDSLWGFDYLIQYQPEEKFGKMKSFPFRRFFPYRMDTIFIYKRIAPD